MASASNYETFLASQQQQKYPIPEVQLSALRTLFSDPSIPVSQVAKQIAGPLIEAVEKQLKGERSTDVAGAFWRTIADAVKNLTSFNDRLVELVVEIQKVVDPTDYLTQMWEYKEHWTEFAFSFKDPSSKDPEYDIKRQGWVNMNSFCAKLSTRNFSQLDERQRAAWVMRHTLEKTPWEHPLEISADPEDPEYRTKREYEVELHDVRTLNSWIPAATVWYQINAQGLYEMEGPMQNEREWIVTNWKGNKGWSKERYAFWRERFEIIGGIGDLEEKTRELAKQAAMSMRGVEKGESE